MPGCAQRSTGSAATRERLEPPLGHTRGMTDLLRSLTDRIDEGTARVVIVGQGHVGLPLAMRAVEVGFPVVGYDSSAERVAALRAGRSYVGDVSDAQLRSAQAGPYETTDDGAAIGDFDVAVVTVPTPLRDGVPDLSFIEAAVRTVALRLRRGALVVLESTTYPGTTDELVVPILEATGLQAGRDFFCGYSPERIDPGNHEWTLANTPKVVSGVDALSLAAVEAFYGRLVDKVVPVGSTAEAELVKLLENTFRHVNIALVNELAMFARELGVDIWSAIDAAGSKPFGFMSFRPGPGVGGHCLPVDPSFLAWRVERRLGHRFRFVELANDVNAGMPEYVVRRAQALLNVHGRAVKGSRILIVGLAYKAGTSDWRESPATTVARTLADLGADVRAYDPLVPLDVPLGPDVRRVGCDVEEISAADLVLLLVEHEGLPYDDITTHARLVLDTRGRLRGMTFRGEVL
jgi:UDP-N-acetyl-D-glucosamine dehydrogenase